MSTEARRAVVQAVHRCTCLHAQPVLVAELKFDVNCFFLLFSQEKNEVLSSLKEKANLITKLFNSIEGIKCNPVEGAMYAFPKITIPKRAVEKAQVSQIS